VTLAGSRISSLKIPVYVETEEEARATSARRSSFHEAEVLEPGTLIAARYRVEKKLGEGGMGMLYACEDSVLHRRVAVKLMQRALAADPGVAERLLREARLAAQLRKHVAQVFDCGTLDTGEPYIVMELLSGQDLYAVLREDGPLPPAQVVRDLLDVCVGLGEAHEKGIIHRDLKPENLFRAVDPDGTVELKIVDFGISKQLSSRLRAQTNPSESVGSPQYMSPEQITTPSEVDPRTDIWSLGVVMFELLTGALPFEGQTVAQICSAVLTQPVPPFSDYRDDVPPALQAVVMRCLHKDRNQRFQTVADVSLALSALSVSDFPPSRVMRKRLRVQPRSRRWLGAFVALCVVGACLGVMYLAVREGRLAVPQRSDVVALAERLKTRLHLRSAPPEGPAPAAPQAPAPAP